MKRRIPPPLLEGVPRETLPGEKSLVSRTLLLPLGDPPFTVKIGCVSNVNQAFGVACGTVSGGGQVSPSEAYAIGSALSGSVFEVGLGIGAVVEIALTVLTPVDIGPEFVITTLIAIIVGTALQEASTSGLFGKLGAVTGLDTAALDAVKSFTDTTPPSLDENYTPSWQTILETFLLTFKIAALPITLAVGALEIKNAANPVLPAILLAMALTTIVLTFWLLLHFDANLVTVLVALIFGAVTTAFSIRSAVKMSGPLLGLKGLAIADAGLALVGPSLTLYKFLGDV